MKNAVIKSLYESMSMLRESYEYWTEEDWANELKKICHLNKQEADDLLHDLNNLRGNEWLEIIEDKCDDEELFNAFKEFIGVNDIWEDEFDESLNENIRIEDFDWKIISYGRGTNIPQSIGNYISTGLGKKADIDEFKYIIYDCFDKFDGISICNELNNDTNTCGKFTPLSDSNNNVKIINTDYLGNENIISITRIPRGQKNDIQEDYNSDLQEERKIQKYFDDHDLWGEVSVQDGTVYVEIHWGDWKHEHWYCQDLMSELGYVLVGKEVTEEDGSDTFSAIHTYEKMNVNEE